MELCMDCFSLLLQGLLELLLRVFELVDYLFVLCQFIQQFLLGLPKFAA